MLSQGWGELLKSSDAIGARSWQGWGGGRVGLRGSSRERGAFAGFRSCFGVWEPRDDCTPALSKKNCETGWKKLNDASGGRALFMLAMEQVSMERALNCT